MDINNQTFQPYEFHYATISMEPYANRHGDSGQLLKEILIQERKDDLAEDLTIIDRYKDRKGETKRELLIVSNRWSGKGTRCYGRIALIKQKPLYVLSGRNLVEELLKDKNKRFIEVSHFVFHFPSTGEPIVMFEFNNEGPRLSDLEFFIRQISTHYKIGKKIQFALHLDIDYSDLDKKITNVFNISVRVPSYAIRVNEWLPVLRDISDASGYKDVRLEFFYRRAKDDKNKYKKNIKALTLARNLIHWISKDTSHINDIDDLKMSYITQESDEILTLDFLKNRTESLLKIPTFDGAIKREDFDSIVGTEFDHYLNTGYTTK